ncbi:MAG: efflux RND transporter periplasmic adaptor subunit [Acidobacteriota bacterium]
MRPLLVVALLAAAGMGAWLYLRTARASGAAQTVLAATRTATVQRGTLDVRLRISGSTTATDFVNITAPRLRGPEAGPMVILKLAAAGAMVNPGDVVLEFDPQSMKDHLDDTIDGLRDRQNDVAKRKVNNELRMENLRQSLRQAKAAVDKAALDYRTLDVRTDIDRELLRLALEEAQAAYKEMQAEVALTEQSLAADLRNAEIAMKMEELHVARHENDLTKLVIRSPIHGMVVLQTMFRPGGDQVTVAVGDRMGPGQPVMKIINPGKMMVEGTVNQAEVTRLRIGQEAVIGLDAFPEASYRGKVYSIGAIGVGSRRENYYIRNIPVRVILENADSRVIPDLSAFANVLVDRQENALLVPAAAVGEQDGRHFVFVRTEKGFEKREVKAGLSNGVQTAILEGLKEGDVVRAQY